MIQNLIEQEGTYSLSEAQLDRFLFNIMVKYPSRTEEIDIMRSVTTDSDPVVEKVVEVPVEKVVTRTVEKIVEVPVQPPLPDRFVAPKSIDTAQLYGGLTTQTKIAAVEGDIVTVERENAAAYQIEMTLKMRIPKPNPDFDAEVYQKSKEYSKRVLWGPFEGHRRLEADEK